jgi:hypothetical protein
MSNLVKMIVGIVVIVILVAVAGWFWPKSVTRFSGQNRPNGVILGVGQEDLEKTMADNYDFGMEDGLNRSGVRTISLDELRDIADEGIRRYSRYVGDPKYREEQEELDQQEIQQQNAPPPQGAVRQQSYQQQNVRSPQGQQRQQPPANRPAIKQPVRKPTTK